MVIVLEDSDDAFASFGDSLWETSVVERAVGLGNKGRPSLLFLSFSDR